MSPAEYRLAVVTCLAQMVGLPAATWQRLAIWLVVGLVVYFAMRQVRRVRQVPTSRSSK